MTNSIFGVVLLIGISRDSDISVFYDSLQNLHTVSTKVYSFVGIPETLIEKTSNIQLDGLTFVPLPLLLIKMSTRTAQYSWLRNTVYQFALKIIPMSHVDFIIVSDIDMTYPITINQWKSNFILHEEWDVMTANGLMDRAPYYYDIFALRYLNQTYSRNMEDIYPLFRKHYGKSWKWVKPTSIFKKFAQVRTAHGGISIYKGKSWRQHILNNKPFDENITYSICEHVPLQEKFHKIFINPNLIFYHEIKGHLPFDKYKIILPRNGGFFSVFNYIIGALSMSHRTYPLWKYIPNKKIKINHFSYLGNSTNEWLTYFEPIQYWSHDKTMLSKQFTDISTNDYIKSYKHFPPELMYLHERPFFKTDFFDFRNRYHNIYKKYK